MRVGHRNGFLVASAGASLLLGAIAVRAATTRVTIVVTDAPGIQWDPAVRGGLVAYTDLSGGDGDIRVYDLDTGTTIRVVDDAASQTLEDIDGHYVVYTDDRNSAGTGLDIYAFDLSTRTERPVVVAAGNQMEPAISGNRVVWESADGTNVDIYAGDVTGGTPLRLTSHPSVQWRPAISGDLVVWEDARNGSPDIFGYWFSAPPAPFVLGENPIALGAPLARRPDVDGTRVVWDEAATGSAPTDIVLFDFATNATTRITDDPFNQTRPRISGNLIVWEDDRNAATRGIDLYGFDLETGTEIAFVTGEESERLHDVDVRADGGYDIAYTVDRGGGNMDILVLRVLVLPDPEPTPTPGPGDPCDPDSGAPEYFAGTFERGTGAPQWEPRTFSAPPGPATMCLTLEHVSSAWVELGGERVFGPSDFNAQATSARADVTLLAENDLGVKLAGQPCGGGDGGDGGGSCGSGANHDHGGHHGGHHGGTCRHKRPHGHRHGHGDRGHEAGGEGDGDDEGGDDDDAGGDGTCARMTVRVVGPVPAPPSGLELVAGESTERPSHRPQAGAGNDRGELAGCSIAATAPGVPGPAGWLLLAGLALAARRRRP